MEPLPRPIAFVLSGGSSLGAVQVGMLLALRDAGILPDFVLGSSVGAINGVRVAYEPSSAPDALERIWRGIRRSDIFPGGLATQARTLVSSRTHLFPASGLRSLIRENLPAQRFDELAVPFGAIATDARTGRAVVLRDGDLEPALLASAAIPGVFAPVPIGDATYVDGGVACNLPMAQAVALGAASLVVLEAGFPCDRPAPPANLVESLLFATAVLIRNQGVCELPAVAARIPVIYPPTPCPQSVSPFDFSHSGELIDSVRESTAGFLRGQRLQGPGVYGHPHAHDHELPGAPFIVQPDGARTPEA